MLLTGLKVFQHIIIDLPDELHWLSDFAKVDALLFVLQQPVACLMS